MTTDAKFGRIDFFFFFEWWKVDYMLSLWYFESISLFAQAFNQRKIVVMSLLRLMEETSEAWDRSETSTDG